MPAHITAFSPLQAWPRDLSQAPLTEVEKSRVIEAEGEEDKARAIPCARRYLPCHYFDSICGSSTGALIAIMLGRFRMTVPDCIYEYRNLGQEIFGKPRFFTAINFGVSNRHKYNAENLARVCKEVTKRRNERTDGEVFGKITFPSRRGLCTTFVTTKMSLSQGEVGKEYLIRSYDHDKQMEANHSDMRTRRTPTGPSRANTTMSAGLGTRKEKEPRTLSYGKAQEFEIWQVARAATAAPLYFEPLKVEKARASGHILFTDGGFSHTNNPTQQGQREIEKLKGSDSIGIFVSVGTARKKRVDTSSPWRRFFNIISRQFRDLADGLTDPETVHEETKRDRDRQGFAYYRLNDEEGLDVELDSWEPKQSPFNKGAGSRTIDTIDNAFARWAAQTATIEMFRSCAETLVECRRRRMDTPKWERFATGARYRCRRQYCDLEDVFERGKFENHLREHGIPEHELSTEAEKCKDCWRYQDGSALHAHKTT